MFAGTQLDLVIGVDLHMEMVPMPAPTPMPFPHPFVGVMEPDAIGFLVETGLAKALSWAFDTPPSGPVLINGFPAVKTGDEARNRKTLPHIVIPPGTMWTPMPKPLKLKLKPGEMAPIDSPIAPAGDAVMVTGSKTVLINGSNACRLGDLAMSCGEPVRLPSSTLLAIPKGMPVLIGGPPALDYQAAATAFFLRNKWTAGLFHQLISRLAPGRLRSLAHFLACTLTGHPVDVATGRMMTFPVDFELPGPIPITFQRIYASSWSERWSPLGYGWSHTFDESVFVVRGKVVYRTGDAREIEFDTMDLPGRKMARFQELFDPVTRLTLRCEGEGKWTIRSPDGLLRDFALQEGDARTSRLVAIRDAADNRISLEYYLGNLDWVVDSAGRRMRFNHDPSGLLRRISLPTPRGTVGEGFSAMEYDYSPDDDLIAARDAHGKATTYEYDRHLMVRETDRDGVSFYFVYSGDDATASCVRTWGDGGVFDHEIIYDRMNLRTIVTDSLGHSTTYQMNAANLVVGVFDAHAAKSWTEYNEHLWKTAEIDPYGNATRFAHDARGDVTATTLPNGVTATMRYDARDRPESGVDAAGVRWTWFFDELGRLTHRSSTLGERLVVQYEGKLPSVVTRNGLRHVLRHDAQGNLTHVTRPDGATFIRKFDALGRLRGFRDVAGNLTVIHRDLLGRVVATDDPEGTQRTARYSAEGDVLAVHNGYALVTYTYEGFHALASRSVENADTVRWRHDTEGRLVEVTNENGEAYTFVRDARGDVQQEIGFDKRRHTFVRDLQRRVTMLVKPSGIQQMLAYDVMGNLTELKHPDGAMEAFTYSPLGDLLTATNEHGTVWFQRDERGRVLAEGMGDEWVQSAFDWQKRRVGMRTSRGLEEHIDRDEMGLVHGVRVPQAGWGAGFQRDVFGQETARALPGGVQTRWERDNLGRPRVHHVAQGAEWTRRTAYEWHGLERIRAIEDSIDGPSVFEHDARSRLVAAARPTQGRVDVRFLDPAGNLYKRRDGSDRRYGRGGVLLEDEGVLFGYDPNGNVIIKELPNGERWEYAWNAAGRLTEVKRPDGLRVAFKYDALARRIEKAVYPKDAKEPASVVRWVWDGNVPVHEIANDEKVTTWLFEPGSFAPLGKLEGDEAYGVVTDHLGTPTQMFDRAGKLAWQMQLDVYGVGREDIAETACPWRWPGQYRDEETGLAYNRFRYFDAHRGDYLQQDPLGLLGGLTPYAYVPNPLRQTDVFALSCSSDAKELRENMVAEGIVEPGYANDAHHIVLSNSTNADMTAARQHMNALGIKTNDAANGIFLPATRAVSQEVFETTGQWLPGHKTVHTTAYIEDVSSRILGATTKEEVLSQLSEIKEGIAKGLYGRR